MSMAKPASGPAATPPRARELIVYGHSSLFYWWPVWLTGFIVGFWTMAHDSRVAIVPKESEYLQKAIIKDAERVGKPGQITYGQEDEKDRRNVVVLPAGQSILSAPELKERMYPSKNPGVIFTVVILVVIMITNVPLRGLSSAIAIVLILFFTVLFAYLGWWEYILDRFRVLSIHMNAGFYFFFSGVLLVLWSLSTFLYDHMSFWRVRPGQITHEYRIGGGEKAYSTDGMTFEKLRSDLFRHWILGFGSGDMIMHPLRSAAGTPEELEVQNVLFVGSKLRRIQELIAERPDQDAG